MDRMLDVRTPESVTFSYELAGLGSRALAVLLDLLVQMALVLLLFWGLIFAAGHIHVAPAHHTTPEGERFARNIAVGFLIFVVFVIFFGYFIVLEALWNGQTAGKKALGIRVVRDGGYPLDWGASLVRNLIRVGEMLFGSYALSAICALVSPQNKRIGDIAAGTIVVRVGQQAALPHFEPANQAVYAATGYVSGEERVLIHRFIERRDTLQSDRRRDLAARLAGRVRGRVPADLQRLDDEALLERL